MSQADISFDVSSSSGEVKDATYAAFIEVNKVMRKVKAKPVHLLLPPLDIETLHLSKDVLRVDVQRIVLHQRYRYSAFEPCVHPPT